MSDRFRTLDDLTVELVDTVRAPYELAVASARTCYSGKGIVYPEQVSKDDKAIELRDRIAASTREAGHLTTRQHAHFVFAITGVSRQCLWSFLHAHPHYNSEQVSQRYVRVKRDSFLRPSLEGKAAEIYETAALAQMDAYETLIGALREPLTADFITRFPARKKTLEKWQKGIDKRAFEVARYVLGVGTTAYLYHTVSALTLLRYQRLCTAFDVPEEQRLLVGKMIAAVQARDPLFGKDLDDPIPLEQTTEFQLTERFASTERARRFRDEFDAKLDGKYAKLVAWTNEAERAIADGARITLGVPDSDWSTEAILKTLLDPAENKLLGETLNVAVLDRLSTALRHVHFTFYKKISHAADSQDQRHRTVASSRPALGLHYDGTPDYVVPFGVTQSRQAEDLYRTSMEQSFRAVGQLLELGVPKEKAFYLLPNAFPIRLVATGDLQSLQHKWRLRLCYNAQEEIFRASKDEVAELAAVFPRLTEHLRAPCYQRQRAGLKPYCPEGERFCGLPVWKLKVEQYERKSL